MGYSLPETDAFFRLLYGLGTIGANPLEKLVVMNPDPPLGDVDMRFQRMLGPGAQARYQYIPLKFEEGIADIKKEYPARR